MSEQRNAVVCSLPGTLTLRTDEDPTRLRSGMCASFRARGGHARMAHRDGTPC